MKYIEKEFKTAVNKYKFIDSWFWCRYSINPYSGCEHACIYCDARSERYYLQEVQDFETEVIAETENFLAWRADEPDGESTYHLELNNLTVHFFTEEWQEFLELADTLLDR